MKIFTPEFKREDDRGSLIQIITQDFKQLNLLKIKPGNVFGGHYHKNKYEFFYVISGDVELIIEDLSTNIMLQSIKRFTSGDCFLIEPFDKHTLKTKMGAIIAEALTEPHSEGDVYV